MHIRRLAYIFILKFKGLALITIRINCSRQY